MYLSDEDFNSIYSKVPRLVADLCIRKRDSLLLSLRNIEPYLGCWHMPGGTVYKGETLEEAAVRIAKKETGLTVNPCGSVGHMEFLNETRGGLKMHTISIVISAEVVEGDPCADENADRVDWFTTLPEPMVPEHKKFLSKTLNRSFITVALGAQTESTNKK